MPNLPNEDATLPSLFHYVSASKIAAWKERVSEPPTTNYFLQESMPDFVRERHDALTVLCDTVLIMLGVAELRDDTDEPIRHLHGNVALIGKLCVATVDGNTEETRLTDGFVSVLHGAAQECSRSGYVSVEWEMSGDTSGDPRNCVWMKASLWRLQGSGENGEMRFAYTVEDISAYRATEDVLRVSHGFFEKVALATPHIWYIYDLDEQRNVYANREIAAVLGYSADEIQAMGAAMLPSLIHPDDLPEVVERFGQHPFRADNSVTKGEFRARRKDGVYRWLDCHEVPFARNESTGLVRQMLGVSQDITERREAQDALAQSEGYLRLAVESADIGTFVADLVSGIVQLSLHARRHLGLDSTQDTITLAAMRELVYDGDRTRFDEATEQAIHGSGLFRAEYRVSLPSGELRWGSTVAQMRFDSVTGTPLQMIGVCTDIEDRKRTEEKQREETRRQGRIVQALQRSILSVAPKGGHFHPGERGGMIILGAADTQNHWDIALLYEPAWSEAQVGGDFYDIFAVDTERTAFVIGDVSGKGLGAAESVAEIKFGLRSVLRGISADPSFALRFLNDRQIEAQELDERSRELLFAVTIVVADNETGVLQIARAGAESPLICRSDESGTLLRFVSDIGDLPIGAFPETQYTTLTETLTPGETLLVYTDGLTETGEPGDGAERLQQAIWKFLTQNDASSTPLSCSALCRNVVDELAPTNAHRRDDTCLLAVRRVG